MQDECQATLAFIAVFLEEMPSFLPWSRLCISTHDGRCVAGTCHRHGPARRYSMALRNKRKGIFPLSFGLGWAAGLADRHNPARPNVLRTREWSRHRDAAFFALVGTNGCGGRDSLLGAWGLIDDRGMHLHLHLHLVLLLRRRVHLESWR